MAQPFNFTGRDDLTSKDIEIKPDTKSPRLKIFFKQHLAEMKKYSGCDVMIEAYRSTKAQRVELGMVNKLAASVSVTFDEFPDVEGMQFRVKVVEPGTKRIRAKADGLKPPKPKAEKKGKTRSLLPVLKANDSEGLKGRFWKVQFSSDHPTLLIASKYPNTQSVNEPAFQALAWPAILKEVLTYAFIVKCHGFPPWSDDWLTLATKVLGVYDGAPEEEPSAKNLETYLVTTADWIDSVAAAFATKRNLASITSEYKQGGSK